MPGRPTHRRHSVPTGEAGCTDWTRCAWRLLVNVPPMSNLREHVRLTMRLWTRRTGQMLLRKEVIQPHLPVRLPCYDFVPIASPTFDGSLPQGLGHRLRVLPTFVT